MRSPVATRARSAKAAAGQLKTGRQSGAAPAAAAPPLSGPPAEEASGTGAAISKRPREAQLSEDDFSCSVCLSLLVDPVVGSCGHDFCELCFQRWTVDQGKNSCPACRKALGSELPGICHRLQRTIEALFPQRLEERQAEVAEARRALAAEKRARDEARRQQAQQHEAAAGHTHNLLHVVLETILNEPIFRRQPAGGRAASPQRGQQAQQAQQAQAGRSVQGAWPQTLQQQAGRLVQRRYPTRQAAAATAAVGRDGLPPVGAFLDANAPADWVSPGWVPQQQAVQQQQHEQAVQQQQQQQQMSLAHGLQSILASLMPGGQRQQQPAGPAAAAVPAFAQQQQQQQARGRQMPQQQQQHAQHMQPQLQASFEVQVVHFAAIGGQRPPAQIGNGPFHAIPLTVGPGAGGAASSTQQIAPGAGWPMGPPLNDMQFEMGWYDPNDGRRRRQSRSGL